MDGVFGMDRPDKSCGGNPYKEHNWEKWVSQEEGGVRVVTRGRRAGHLEYFSREWQERTCQDCGLVEMRPDFRKMPEWA